ncbi:hypothetical protein [Serratia sp. Ag1]|uniref:hypothetical protein n=1 Tax=Serratia sp. Ag1 TaxID=1524467 RepID=UPI0005009CDA|nr:hypothetical protein [Serratia sp. Ag1]KFK93813.1 hypothetical protein IV04_23590 [Serratia sp. Ag1]
MTEYFDIPEIAYCRVDRASRLIGCEVEDLYHWMETQTINGYLNIPFEKDFIASFTIGCNEDDADNYLRSIDWSGGYFPFTAYSVGTLLFAKFEKESYPLKYSPEFESCNFDGQICGVWRIDSGLEYLFDDSNEIDIRRLLPYGSDLNKNIYLSASVNMKVMKKNIWLVKEDIEKLAGKEFRSLEGGLGNISSRIANEVTHNKEENTKTTNSRAQFIKSLLHIHYGSDVAESPRRFLEQNNSIIIDDFRKMNIKPPSGKSVQAWIEMVDIPFNDES